MLNRSMFVVLLASIVGLVLYLCPELHTDPTPPKLVDGYFGKGPKLTDPEKYPKDNPAVRKFEIKVTDEVLQDLNSRLNKTHFVEPLENVQFQYGFHASFLKEVIEYWKSKFDWRKQEKELNKFRHFKTQIEGIDIHYIHQTPNVKSKQMKSYPLLLVHGWPGSIAEFTEILPILANPRSGEDFAFEVICPSLPGYGFSEAPHQTGFSVTDSIRVFIKLMDRLGFKQFYVQGGDWGAAVATDMAKIYSDRVKGVHVTMVPDKLNYIGLLKYFISHFVPNFFVPSTQQQEKILPFSKLFAYLLQETGYMHIQATKPDTVGAALTDSPAGLAAYILEKFYTWTHENYTPKSIADLTQKFSMDQLLTNVMIYWTTGSITSSMRFYKERFSEEEQAYRLEKVPVKIPSGLAIFPNELIVMPESFVKPHFRNLLRYREMPRGGHFAAMEEPRLLADEIFEFVKDVETFRRKETKEL